MILRNMLVALLIAAVCGQQPDNVAVVEGIPVPNGEDGLSVAQDRIDLGDYQDDQIAEESQLTQVFAQDRDGGGHSHDHSHEHGPVAVAVPAPASYDTPQAPPAPAPVAEEYGAPQAAPIDGYGSPQAAPVSSPPIDEYGAPQAPLQTQYQPPRQPQQSGPIPVPLPLQVQPGSIVIPAGPRPQQPQYAPRPPQKRPPPPQKPKYRPPPPPQKRPPPPQKPQYRPPPPQKRPPKYQPRPQPPKKQVYQPAKKPQYRPPPPKPQYKPRPTPPKPAYIPKPTKPAYKPKPQQYKPAPQKPAYKPAPQAPKQTYNPQPAKQTYAPQPIAVPNNPAPSYVQPSANKPDDPWPQAQPDMPKITSLDVQCEKNLMKVSIKFDKPFYGIIFSKGFYSDVNCVHLPAGVGRSDAQFDIAINSCGTTGNTENGLYGYGADSGSGTFFENTIVVQYDPQVQEVWDQARKLRCTWHEQYEKSVTFRPFPVDMLDVVRADFAGDNVGCWMQIQVGKGPWASEVSGLVKIGQTMTMVLAIKDDEQKFDMLVRNCMAHDGKRAPIQLVDQKGCVTRPKLMSKFTKIKNFGASASVLSYAHFQAFKFPDSMEVHFQCTIQICRYNCPEQCVDAAPTIAPVPQSSAAPDGYGAPVAAPQNSYNGPQRTKRAIPYGLVRRDVSEEESDDMGDIGVEKVIHVVSSGDLTFDIKEGGNDTVVDVYPAVAQSLHEEQGYICMSTPAFAATLIILLAILIISCFLSAFLCLRHRSYYGETSLIAAFTNPVFAHKKGHF